MKKFLIICTIGIACGAANAATLCAKRPTTCDGGDYSYKGNDWNMTCEGVVVHGVSAVGEVAEYGTISETVPAYKNSAGCWCRMVYPFVSKWVAISNTYSTSNSYYVAANCAYGCDETFRYNQWPVSAFFNNPAF